MREQPGVALKNPPAESEKSSLITAVKDYQARASTAFRRVGDYLIAAPAEFMNRPTREIADAVGVSEPTVMRYCRNFGFKGIPDFRIALAMSLVEQHMLPNGDNSVPASGAEKPPAFLEPKVSDKAVVNREQKTAIAAAALHLLDPDRSIILDSGSTAAIFAGQLRQVSARTILTTGLNVIESLWGAKQHNLILPGGTLRFESRSLSGRMVESSLANMHFDTGYFGADSINPETGLGTFSEDEAHLSAALMGACSRVVVLADSTKFRSPALHRICSIESIDIIVTDTGIAPEIAQAIRDRGCQLICVPPATNDNKPDPGPTVPSATNLQQPHLHIPEPRV